MDEADRLVDISFEENVKSILGNFKYQRQTVLFSATMPKQVLEFAKTTLTDPIVVNASRAGAANLDVIQEVEYVKEDARLVYLLECLQKTAPPVLVFAEKKESVDAIQEFLLLKGVDTVAIHGGLAQADRTEAIRLFREGQKDVLVATDVASKGLDFDGIQHVINYDMPKEIGTLMCNSNLWLFCSFLIPRFVVSLLSWPPLSHLILFLSFPFPILIVLLLFFFPQCRELHSPHRPHRSSRQDGCCYFVHQSLHR